MFLFVLFICFNLRAQDCVNCEGKLVTPSLTTDLEKVNDSFKQIELLDAVKSCEKRKVRRLISRGAVLNAPASEGELYTYPVFKAVKNCSLDYIKFLEELGANFNVRREYESTPLIIPAIRWGKESAKYLIKKGLVDVNITNSSNKSPLMVAVYYNDKEIISELLKHENINLNKMSIYNKKNNALTRAARSKDSSVFELLLNHDKDIAPFNDKIIDVTIKHLSSLNSQDAKDKIDALELYRLTKDLLITANKIILGVLSSTPKRYHRDIIFLKKIKNRV